MLLATIGFGCSSGQKHQQTDAAPTTVHDAFSGPDRSSDTITMVDVVRELPDAPPDTALGIDAERDRFAAIPDATADRENPGPLDAAQELPAPDLAPADSSGPADSSIDLSPDTWNVPDAGNQNCAVTTHSTTKQSADLLLILDRSSSMTKAMDVDRECETGATDCVARWPATKSALSTVFAASAARVNWGLKMYSTPGEGNCTVSNGVEVPVATGNASSINGMINQATPGGNTPTRKAVAAGVEYLKTLTTPGGKSILLVTDGQPNCKGTSVNTTSDVAAAVDAVKAASDAGFKVYVLGIGPDVFTQTLNDFAAAGGTAQADVGGPGKNYYAAVSAEELSKNLNSIVEAVASCSLRLDSKPQAPDNIAVEFDGDKSLRAPRDVTNGWEYASDTTIQLYGSWCDGLTNGTYKSVRVLFGCPGQIIP